MKKILCFLFILSALTFFACENDSTEESAKDYTCMEAQENLDYLYDPESGMPPDFFGPCEFDDKYNQNIINCVATIKDKADYYACFK